MKKKIMLALFLLVSMWSAGTYSYASAVRVFSFPQSDTGVTIVHGGTGGVSRVAVIDLKTMGPGFVGIYNLSYPHGGRGNDGETGVTVITFAVLDDTSATRTTGNANTAGVTVPYYYVVTDTPKTAREIETLGVSGVTLIAAIAVDSSTTPTLVHSFLPEFGRHLHILVGSSSTPYTRPGAIVAIQ